MALLFDLIGVSARSASRFIRCAVASVWLPRLPPRNWTAINKAATVVRVKGETKYAPMLHLCYVVGPNLAMPDYVDLQHFLCTESKERILVKDFPVLLETPRPANSASPQIILQNPQSGVESLTVLDASESILDFSIYSDVSSPNLNKAVYITPVRPKLPSTTDVDLSLLRAASERVSEILRENRRRLDAGEDPSTVRREARRKRAQELSAARNHGSLSATSFL